MKNVRWAYGSTLAIAFAFLGCGGSSSPTKDASVDRRGTDTVSADSGGVVRDAGGAGILDSGVEDMVVVEGGIRDGTGDRSISAEVGPALDLAGADVPAMPDAPVDTAARGQDSGAERVFSGDSAEVGCPAGYHENGIGICVVNGTEGSGRDGGGTGTGGAGGKNGGTGTDGAAGATGTGGAIGTGGAGGTGGATGSGGATGTGGAAGMGGTIGTAGGTTGSDAAAPDGAVTDLAAPDITAVPDSPADVAVGGGDGDVVSSKPTFVQIPNINLSTLGQKIAPVDLSQYVEGGSAPLAFVVISQTATDNVVCSVNGTQLVSDYSYYAGTNTVTVSVTDANQKSAQTTLNVIVTIPQVTYQLFGIDYSPYVGAQNPNDGTVIGDDQLIQQIGAIAPYTTAIRSFGCTSGLENFAKIAKRFRLKVYVGAWISNDPTASSTELQNCISVAQTVPVDAAIIGSEALLRNDVTPTQLITYINQFRSAVPGVPVTTADQYLPLENNPAVVAACDFVFANFYPFWEKTDISTAVASLNAEDALLRATYAPKEVIVSETGWQSFGAAQGNAVPSSENAASYFLNFESWAQAEKQRTFYFEAHDEPWKSTDDGWGIWDQNMVMKPGMIDVFNGVTMADNWTCDAVPGGSGTPVLQFTSVPLIGSSSWLQGQEWHVVPANYYVVVYIHVGSYGWWVKPYANPAVTTIACDGTWSTNIVTGGSDASADQIAAFLIPTTYIPPSLMGAATLPADLYTNSVANKVVPRP